MNKYSEENILSFLTDLLGCEKITSQTDIFEDLGVVGIDFHEMMEKYAEKFNVDMTSYLWYFHSGEEGLSIGREFFKSPYDRVNRIPVTPKMLTEFANKTYWDIAYPDHKLPKRRWDILINQGLAIGLFIWLLVKWLMSYFE